MRNPDLARDYVRRAAVRLRALDVLFDGESWADVVRESQEIVELTLNALLRVSGIDPPRIHDVSEVILAEREQLPMEIQADLEALAGISRQLRRDRELAFYGAEDLTPSDPSPLLERVALLPKVRVEREGPINPVRSHELEGGGVYQTQLPGVSKQQVVEGPLVCRFVLPEHV